MSRTLRFGCGIAFAFLGLFMLVVAAILGSFGIAALFKGTSAEAGAVGALFFVAASVSLLWIQLALRLTGARATPPSLRGRALMWLVALEGLAMLAINFYPHPSSNPFGPFLALLVTGSAIVYAAVRSLHDETPPNAPSS
jgi:hypothetical protein